MSVPSTLRTALATVYRRPWPWLHTILIALLVSGATLLWRSRETLSTFAYQPHTTIGDTVSLALTLLWGTPHAIGLGATVLVLMSCLLLGVNISLLWYIWHTRQRVARTTLAAASGGTLLALLGLGCVACGPLLIGSVLAALGAGGLLVILPYHGAEVGVIALTLLLYGLYASCRIIARPGTCPS